jgi:hypothetical protein
MPRGQGSQTVRQGRHKNTCSLCARRKVKCDKGSPCSNCLRSHADCTYENFAAYTPRRRAADLDLLARLSVYEDLMRKNNVDFAPHANVWVHSGLEVDVKERDVLSPVSMTSSKVESLGDEGRNLVK